MKKLMMFVAFAATIATAPAASISWGFDSDVYVAEKNSSSEDSASLYGSAVLAKEYLESGTIASGAYLALVYVGQNKETFSLSDIQSQVDTMDFTVDQYSTWTPEFKKYTLQETDTFVNNASFAVVWYNGSEYDYVYDQTDGTAMTTAGTLSDVERGSLTLGAATDSENYSGYVANVVPEPSVAILGLLGLGMLIKRRRA